LIKFELDTKASIIICNDFIEFFGPSKNKVFEIIVDERIRNVIFIKIVLILTLKKEEKSIDK